jgi:hypothetical protein
MKVTNPEVVFSEAETDPRNNAAVNVNSVPPLVRGRRVYEVELTANPEEPNIFSPSIFWRTHSNYAP